jgi:RNA polymerase sigma-70 factor, ECF subfamily
MLSTLARGRSLMLPTRPDETEVQDAEGDSNGSPETESPSIADSALDPMEQLAAVYRDYPGLRALILRRVQDPQLAADILQDAAVTTLEKLRAGEIAQPSGIGGYLYRVALNHLRNYRRKDRTALSSSAELEALPDGDDNTDTAGIDRARWAKAARSMLEELPAPRDRELLVRFYLNDECKESICSSLGLSDEHFHRVLFRARNRFRALIKRRGYQKLDLLALALLGVCMATICSAMAFWPFAMGTT